MRILVVDDNLLSSTAVLEQLRRAGHTPVVSPTLSETLRIAHDPAPDLILVNLAARAVDPPILIRTLRDMPGLRTTRIVGFCGHLEHNLRTSALTAGCDHVITNAVAFGQLGTFLGTLSEERSKE